MPLMKGLVYTAPGRVEVQEMERPEVGPEEVLVRVEVAGICGSDMGGFLGHHARRQPPLVLGHEMVGFVDRDPGGQFLKGERVVINPLFPCFRCRNCLAGRHSTCYAWKLLGMDRVQGAFAEYVRVPASALFSIPVDLPPEVAVLPEPVACGVHLLSLALPDRFDSLAILGAGTQGMLLLRLARLLGYQEIFVTDVNRERLAVAEQLGASLTLDPSREPVAPSIREATGGGVDVAIDAVGASPVRRQAVEICRPGGQVLLLGLADQNTELDCVDLVRREIQIQASFAYHLADFRKAVKLVTGGQIDLRPWTEIRPLEKGQAAFDRMIHGPGSILKMVLRP